MSSVPKYNEEEKKQLLANLDLEVVHRTRQFQSWLVDRLENFKLHQEGHVSRIPKQVRAMTMKEFGEKYNGNIQAALRGVQRERLAAQGAEDPVEIDKATRKRKWVASQEAAEAEIVHKDGESSRASKSARLTTIVSPQKKAGSSTGPGTAQRSRLLGIGEKTPSKPRTMLDRIPASPSPQKAKPPFTTSTYTPRASSRPISPVKPTLHRPSNAPVPRTRVPSTSTFNPVLPSKTPMYPRNISNPQTMRLPREDEHMLSVNGSPLANPFWKGKEEDVAASGARTLKRTQSNISIRRDPSFVSGLPPSRANSQASFYAGTSSQLHSRNNSDATLAESTHNYSGLPPSSFETPYPITRKYAVTISTKDGHLLEFDPLQTSPGALDALEGITDSAKKQAKEEMGRLVQAAVDKWKVG